MEAQSTEVWIGSLNDTPLGTIWTAVSIRGLVALSLWGQEARFVEEVTGRTGSKPVYAPPRITAVAGQLQAYFHKERRTFELPIDWSFFTPFQETVLRAVCDIPYGQMRTYGDIAHQIGQPHAARAIGRANATNPIPIIIPCHRVIGKDGKLHGYSAPGGLQTKAWLLRLEGAVLL